MMKPSLFRKIILVLFLSISFLLVNGQSANAGYQEGIDALKRGDYVTAFKEFRSLAEQGNAKAQVELSVMYVEGKGVSKDPIEAAKWIRRAANQGNLEGQNTLGVAYREGIGVSQDYKEAVKWFHRAADQGYAQVSSYLDPFRVNCDYRLQSGEFDECAEGFEFSGPGLFHYLQ